jgi:hypothetical protein
VNLWRYNRYNGYWPPAGAGGGRCSGAGGPRNWVIVAGGWQPRQAVHEEGGVVSPCRTTDVVLEQEFLPLRAKILEIAAGLDRLDRASGDSRRDERRQRLEGAIRLLLDEAPTRAEQVQVLFSREYVEGWRKEFGV